MTYLYTNNAVAQLSAGLGTSTTLIQLVSGQGAKFPNPTVGQTFQCTLFDAATQSVIEICTCTSRTSDTLTVVRAQEGTTASSYLIGDGLALRVTAGQLSDMASQTQGANFVGATTAVTAIYGDNSQKIATTAFVAQNTSPINAATLNSPAFTGTPTAPTASLGTSTTQLATTAFVANTAFSSALPAQTGNSGKFVTTNGTTASWAGINTISIPTINATITLSTTLTAALLYIPVAMALSFQTITLPNATTLNLGGPQYIIRNNGTITFAVRDNSGVLIAVVPARSTLLLMLTTNATSYGTWAVGNLSEFQFLSTQQISSTSIVSASADTAYNHSICMITSNTFAMTYNSTPLNGIAIVIGTVNGPVITLGTPVVVATGSVGGSAVASLSATQLIVSYQNASLYPVSCIVNISGLIATPSTPSIVVSTAISAQTNISVLSATQAIIYYKIASNGYPTACVLNISGSTITPASPTTVFSNNGIIGAGSIISINSTQALVNYIDNSGFLNSVILNISGSAITVNTPALQYASAMDIASLPIAQLSSNQFITVNIVGSNTVALFLLTTSGNTVTVSTTTIFSVPIASSWISIVCSSSTSGTLYYNTSTTIYSAVQFSIVGTSIVIGATSIIYSPSGSQGFIAAVNMGPALNAIAIKTNNDYPAVLTTEQVK